MTASIAVPPWSAPTAPLGGAWLFGREILVGEAGAERRVLHWRLARNCSISPRQLGGFFLMLCIFSLAIAVFFLAQGAPWVMAFAGMELLAVGVALLVYARHAGDRESLTLDGARLQVEQCNGNRVAQLEFDARRLAVEPVGAQGSLLELREAGRSVRIGRFLRPELRAPFARELRRALRAAPT
jgi:uncharacterized membrane protein